MKDHNTKDTQKYLASTVWLCGKCLVAYALVKLFLFLSGILNVYYYYFILHVFCLHICLCITCLPGVQEGWKSSLDSLELELQTLCQAATWALGIEPRVSIRADYALNCRPISLAYMIFIFLSVISRKFLRYSHIKNSSFKRIGNTTAI